MDNLYPRSSEYIHKRPKEQVDAEEAENTLVHKESEIIKRVVTRLSERIAFYLTIDALPDDGDELKIAIQANKKTVKALREEKEALELMLEPNS